MKGSKTCFGKGKQNCFIEILYRLKIIEYFKKFNRNYYNKY